jgi:hypothetical protein
MMRLSRSLLLLLGLAMLSAQFALAAHGIEHGLRTHDEPCIECLAVPGFVAVPAQPPCLPPVMAAGGDALRAVPPAPTFPAPLPFRSRAPPVCQNV